MNAKGIKPLHGNLESYGINNAEAHWNLSSEDLANISVEKGMAQKASTGALAVNTGKFTGRSPEDRFIVKDHLTEDAVWWGKINKPFDGEAFDKLYDKVAVYLSEKELFVRDVCACSDERYQVPLRVVNEYPWSNMFVYNMFISPSDEQLENFEPEWHVLNAPGFLADPEIDGTRQGNFSIINFSRKAIIVGGSGYTGEIKKGMFSALNFILPHLKNTLSMHCSANVGKDGDTSLFFGLSGTGKTTLSADPNRQLIGDDEHGWTADDTIFNFEGGCYAKVIDLSEEKEPDIYRAIKPGAILENVIFKNDKNEVDFEDSTITENTRVSYPISFIDNIQEGSIGKNPKNIFFLTCDASGILPPISRLTPGQAAYHFISGYTAKVAGTEEGITEPVAAFSACFGAPFMPLHPTAYAEMLSKKMQAAGVNVWLINTGWSGGEYGVGSRIKLRYTRAMITAALTGKLDNVAFGEHPTFGLQYPEICPNVPDEILNPRNTWEDKEAYDNKSLALANKFEDNFAKFTEGCSQEILKGGPRVTSNI